MKAVLEAIGDDWTSLENLIVQPYTRSDAVYWFLALLELIRLGQVVARVIEENVEFCLAASPTGRLALSHPVPNQERGD